MTATADVEQTLLTDGRVALIRPATTADRDGLVAFHRGLSTTDHAVRFLGGVPATGEELARRLIRPEDAGHAAFVAVLDGRVVGVAAYEALADPTRAEVALAVVESERAHGVGALLLERLAAVAARRGIRSLLTETHPTGEGIPALTAGSPSPQWSTAERGSLEPLLAPRSVAVIVGTGTEAVGRVVVDNIVRGGFTGAVYAVAAGADRFAGQPAFDAVARLPHPPDLAVVCAPADEVLGVIDECGRRGVRATVVTTRLSGQDGSVGRLRQLAERHGIRLVGPDSLGVLWRGATVTLNATFATGLRDAAPAGWPPGPAVGVITGCAGLGAALLDRFGRLGLGVSTLVSTGDSRDVDAADLLAWWVRDPGTSVVVVAAEFGVPRRFVRLAREVAQDRPVVALRPAGLPAGYDPLCVQAGVTLVDGLGELSAAVTFLSSQPLPKGRGVAVLSNSGALATLATQACVATGLRLAEFGRATRDTLAGLLPESAGTANPVDVTALVDTDAFAGCVAVAAADPSVDSVLVVSAPTGLGPPGDDALATASARAAERAGTPLAVVRVEQAEAVRVVPTGAVHDVPVYADPAAAVAALGRATDYGEWRTRPRGRVPDLPGIDVARARATVAEYLTLVPGGGWMDPVRAGRMARAFGIPLAEEATVADAAGAVAAYRRFGRPVSLRAVGRGLAHRPGHGTVASGLGTAQDVAVAAARMERTFGADLVGMVVTPTADPGVEVLVGMATDPHLGPVVVLGAGAEDDSADLPAGRCARLVPLTDVDAAEMVRATRCAPLVTGPGDRPMCDVSAVQEVLLRVARLADLVPQVVELELDPVVAYSHGCLALAARVLVRPDDD